MTDKDRLAAEAMAPKPRLDPQDARPHRNAPLVVRMRARVQEAENGCWDWQGQTNNLGYGMISYKADWGWTSTTAHRKFYELTNGKIPDGMQVNHKCDNRRCINPDHMFLGDQTANIRDMLAKHRDNFRGKGAYLKRKLSTG